MSISFVILAVVAAAVAAATDVRRGVIPNWLTLPALATGVVLHGLTDGVPGLMMAVIGALATASLPFLAFRAGGMGGGDVKLFAALGALVGAPSGLELVFMATIAAALHALALLAVRRRLGAVLRNIGRVIVRPFRRSAPVDVEPLTELRMGPAILVGTVWALVL